MSFCISSFEHQTEARILHHLILNVFWTIFTFSYNALLHLTVTVSLAELPGYFCLHKYFPEIGQDLLATVEKKKDPVQAEIEIED